MSEEEFLDLQYVYDCLKKSLADDSDVIIESYLQGYNELIKFLNLIGTVFSFVSSDVKSKMKVMAKLKESGDAEYYVSFRSMMMYEKEANLHEQHGFVSGSRTMLRLHRGFNFIRLFLKALRDADANSNTCTICQGVYGESLAEFHPWYIRKAATLAMHTLPSRNDMLKKIFGSQDKQAEAFKVMDQTMQCFDEVYSRVNNLYTEFEFHDLP